MYVAITTLMRSFTFRTYVVIVSTVSSESYGKEFFPVATEGYIGRPDRTMRNGTDSQRGAEPRSVKKSPFDCDAATTVRRPISALGDEG